MKTQNSIDFLKSTALGQVDKARKAYHKARVEEVAFKKILDDKEKEALAIRQGCKSESEFTNRRREYIMEAKNDFENAKARTMEVLRKFEMIKEIIQLHKFLVNQEDEQIKLQKYNA